MPPLNAALVAAPDRVIVRLTGDADLSTAPLLDDALGRAAALNARLVLVDVAGARFWDCSGLHALTIFTRRLAAAGRACRLVGTPAATRALIGAADLTEELALAGPVAQADPVAQAGPATTPGPVPPPGTCRGSAAPGAVIRPPAPRCPVENPVGPCTGATGRRSAPARDAPGAVSHRWR